MMIEHCKNEVDLSHALMPIA